MSLTIIARLNPLELSLYEAVFVVAFKDHLEQRAEILFFAAGSLRAAAKCQTIAEKLAADTGIRDWRVENLRHIGRLNEAVDALNN